MRKKVVLGVLIGAFVAGPAVADNVFEGSWKVNLDNLQFPKKPDVYLVQGGMYHCKTCVPLVDIKADGTDQPVKGSPYLDTISIKVVDDHTIEETDKKGGKTVGTSKIAVAKDGKSATIDFTDTTGEPVSGKGTITRVDKGPAGSHAVSGSWLISKMDSYSDNVRLTVFKMEGDRLTMKNRGQSYSAKLDGTDAPFKGDPGTTSISVKSTGKNVIEETHKRDGKVISIFKLTVSADGKTMTVDVDDKLAGTTYQFTNVKQ